MRLFARVKTVLDSRPVVGDEREKEKVREKNNEGELNISLSLPLFFPSLALFRPQLRTGSLEQASTSIPFFSFRLT